MEKTETVNDDGFARWNFDLPAHTDIQQISRSRKWTNNAHEFEKFKSLLESMILYVSFSILIPSFRH
jgi:hypothetical protein